MTLAIDDAYGLLDTVLDDCARAYALVTLEPTVRTDLDELRDHALDAFQAARRVRAWLRPGGGQET